jgi:cytochrome c-type biogenesis protein CcmH/NrfG
MKRAVGWFGVVLMSVLAFVALKHGWADLFAFQGRAVIRTWDREQRSFSNDEWMAAQSRLERSLSLNPGDPSVSEDLGRLHELRTRALPGTGTAAELGVAMDYLRRSLRARPTSPYTWANLAFVKSRLGTLDDEFYHSIQNAALLGPWEPEVQLLLADIGFRYWNRMPKTAQEAIHGAIQRGLKRQDAKLFELASRYGRIDVMCATPGVSRSRRAIRCI